MRRCLELAALAKGLVAPNPLVGALLVHDNVIIGSGYHIQYGAPHAEVNAINSVKPENAHLISASTLYVNLEPCNHFGKTPPCTELILSKHIKKVVIGTLDPNPLVAGKGKQKLEGNGVEVITGILENDCRELNKFFFTFHEKHRPYITLKWAQSADGFIAAEGHKPIHFTNTISDKFVQSMRAEHSAIFVGGRTIISDNPNLTNRSGVGKNPLRITLDTKSNFPENLNILNDEARTLIFNLQKNAITNNVEYIQLQPDENWYTQIHKILFNKNINSILVEGGAETINALIHLNLWDTMHIFTSDHILNRGIKSPALAGVETVSEQIQNNTLSTRINA